MFLLLHFLLLLLWFLKAPQAFSSHFLLPHDSVEADWLFSISKFSTEFWPDVDDDFHDDLQMLRCSDLDVEIVQSVCGSLQQG